MLSALRSRPLSAPLVSRPGTSTCQETPGARLLPCGPQAPLGSVFLPLLIIHSCVQTFIQQTFIENGFWQESRFHLALEQGGQDIALRK